jgi:2-dehydro-3-deoxyphosphogluconate aldolase/(4S)-4-hydroxy-2-oxoglutarate aldolase
MQAERAIQQAIERQGIIAAVRSRAPIDVMLEVGDALLATPLTVVAISPGSRQPWDTIAELRGRFGANMQIGAGPLATPAQVQRAVDAGAQFVLCARFDPLASELCRQRGVLYLPGAATPAALEALLRSGWPLHLFYPAGRSGLAAMQQLLQASPGARLVPMGGVSAGNLGAYARVGASAAVVRGVLSAAAKWRMGALITQMRQLRASWEAGRAGRKRAGV